MIVVGDRVRDVGNLGFEAGLLPFEESAAEIANAAGVARRAVFEYSLACLKHQVQTGKIGIS